MKREGKGKKKGRGEKKGGEYGGWSLKKSQFIVRTDILGYAIRVLVPFGELLDQIGQHGWHVAHGFRIIIEENLAHKRKFHYYGSGFQYMPLRGCPFT